MSAAQEFANKLHRLDALARLHLDRMAATQYVRGEWQIVQRGKVVLRGAYDEVVLDLTVART